MTLCSFTKDKWPAKPQRFISQSCGAIQPTYQWWLTGKQKDQAPGISSSAQTCKYTRIICIAQLALQNPQIKIRLGTARISEQYLAAEQWASWESMYLSKFKWASNFGQRGYLGIACTGKLGQSKLKFECMACKPIPENSGIKSPVVLWVVHEKRLQFFWWHQNRGPQIPGELTQLLLSSVCGLTPWLCTVTGELPAPSPIAEVTASVT